VTQEVERGVNRVRVLDDLRNATLAEATAEAVTGLTSVLGPAGAQLSTFFGPVQTRAAAQKHSNDLIADLASAPETAVVAADVRRRLDDVRNTVTSPPKNSLEGALSWVAGRAVAYVNVSAVAAAAEVATGLNLAGGRYGDLSPDLALAVAQLNVSTVLVVQGGRYAALFAAVGASPTKAGVESFRESAASFQALSNALASQLSGDLGARWKTITTSSAARQMVAAAGEVVRGGDAKVIGRGVKTLADISASMSLGHNTTTFQNQLNALLDTAITRTGAAAKNDRSDASARARNVLIGVGGLIAITLAVWLLVGEALRGRLRLLADSAENLSRGHLASVDPRGPRELTQVAQGLNDAATSIDRVLVSAEHLAAGDLEAARSAPAVGRLGATVQAAVQEVAESIREREALQQELAYQASHDQLTGLPNRAAAERLLLQQVEVARGGEPSLLLFIDLDFFKAVNDTYGHSAGDHVLVVAAARMSEQATGTVCRLGGDEFIVLTAGGLDDAREVGSRIVASLSEPIAWQGHWLTIGASVGIAVCDAATESADQLLTTADHAVYRAKAHGRGTVEL
jgi:diguanylate cyclase (GGDEF)-like protein